MYGLADVDGIRTHFNRQRDFTNHVARIGTDHAASDDTMRFLVKHQLGEAVLRTIGNCASLCSPREFGDGDLSASLSCFVFTDADPRHFWIGVGHTGNDFRIEK